MARKKQTTDPRKAHPPTAAGKATNGVRPRLDMRKRDPFAITAPVEAPARWQAHEGYVRPTNADRYGALVPAWQEEHDGHRPV